MKRFKEVLKEREIVLGEKSRSETKSCPKRNRKGELCMKRIPRSGGGHVTLGDDWRENWSFVDDGKAHVFPCNRHANCKLSLGHSGDHVLYPESDNVWAKENLRACGSLDSFAFIWKSLLTALVIFVAVSVLSISPSRAVSHLSAPVETAVSHAGSFE